MKEALIQKILDEKVIAIVRGVYEEDCVNLARALHEGGVNLLEVTFDQRSAEERVRTANTVRMLNEALGHCMAFGAGTVTSPEMVAQAKEAGAQFIISPNTDESVIRATVEAGLVSIPGAMTPTEIMNAHLWGADFVKLFPAVDLGPRYPKNICAPLSHVRILAVGGVDADNVTDFMAAGAVGAGVSGCLFKKDWVKAGEWERITNAAKTFVGKLK
jgi:2-dehydro-3-deoxyphosphogluconate aldolase/(4S)-4-hydroxy-2-oxoglutarate aldolase